MLVGRNWLTGETGKGGNSFLSSKTEKTLNPDGSLIGQGLFTLVYTLGIRFELVLMIVAIGFMIRM